jgi:CheY-like chemotaxis protein
VGEGSTFWLELPTLDQTVEQETEPRPRTVLYVEDVPSNFTLLENILALRSEVQLIAATHGQAAIDMARAEQPDLILLDLHLPDLPGVDVLRHLKGDPATAAIPITVVSGDISTEQIELLQNAGALSYLTKPLDVGSVLRLVDAVLSETQPSPARQGEVNRT